MCAFQTLPDLVIERILFYITTPHGNSVYLYKNYFGSLSRLCQSWRLVVLRRLLKEYSINATDKKKLDGMSGWPDDLSLPVNSPGPWVKRLCVMVDIPILSSGVDKMYAESSVSYRSAQYMKINIGQQDCKEGPPKSAYTDTARFVEFLQKLAPNVENLVVTHPDFRLDKSVKAYRDLYTCLIRLLLNRFAKRKLLMDCNDLLNLDVKNMSEDVSEIVHLELLGNISEVVELVHRCSKSLQVLIVDGNDTTDALSKILINEDTDEFVVYPRLKHLKLVLQYYKHYKGPYPTFPGAVPFPNLEKLNLPFGYPFGDDVLFRGSQHSLRSASIYLIPNMAKQLTANRTFSGPYSYSSLERVEVTSDLDSQDDRGYLQLIADIGRHAKYLRYKGGYMTKPATAIVISLFAKLSSLQVLHLNFTKLTLADIVELIQKLPRLTDLYCTAFSMSKLPKSWAPKGNLEDLVSAYYPLSKSLKMFGVDSKSDIWNDKMVEAVLCLVILCPNLEQIAVAKKWVNRKFMIKWDEAIGKAMYSEYVEKLETIAINGGD